MNLGQLFFSAGIVMTVIAGAKAPPADAAWPDTLPLFGLGTFLTVVGLILWRQNEKSIVVSEEVTTDSALSKLNTLMDILNQQSSGWKELDCAQLNKAITMLQEQYVRRFVDRRQQIIEQFGMQKGSEIMIACSYGERMLNRVWSATADNHIQEAQSSLQEAVQAFGEVASLLDNEPKS